MPTNNIIANLFTTLFNTEDRRKNNCVVIPTSKLGMEVLKTLKNEGYIGDFEHVDDKRGGKFKIQLLAKITKCGAITPRFKVKKDEYNSWEQQFLFAIAIWFDSLAVQTKVWQLCCSNAVAQG